MKEAVKPQPPNGLQDRLLRTTLVVLRIVQHLSAAAATFATIMAATVWLFPPVTDKFLKSSAPGTLLSFTAAVVLGVIALFMTFLMFGHLIKVVKTVGEGKAFTTENAERLRKIAYLSLGALAAEFAFAAVNYFYNDSTRDGVRWFDWDPSSIITILVLFVLARIFEEGVRLNDEAQLTV
jgi:ABC-type multidrug transport system fused ATPase/permease subunit